MMPRLVINRNSGIAPRKVILRNHQSPGDGVVLSAAIRDLHKAHPGKFITDIRCPWPALFENNPYITKLDDKEAERVQCEYPLIHQADQCGLHFLHGFIQDFERKFGIQIPLTEMKGDIHMTDAERAMPPQVDGDYWIINAGGKLDFTAKWWAHDRWQAVVDRTPEIRWVQIGETGHHHPPLSNVIDLRGKTTLRELVRLVYHAQGVACVSTLAMHLAAAVPTKTGRLRPCVVVAGAREPKAWQQYPGHRLLSNVGSLDCCREKSCWKSRVVPLGDGDEKDKSLCLQPVTA